MKNFLSMSLCFRRLSRESIYSENRQSDFLLLNIEKKSWDKFIKEFFCGFALLKFGKRNTTSVAFFSFRFFNKILCNAFHNKKGNVFVRVPSGMRVSSLPAGCTCVFNSLIKIALKCSIPRIISAISRPQKHIGKGAARRKGWRMFAS